MLPSILDLVANTRRSVNDLLTKILRLIDDVVELSFDLVSDGTLLELHVFSSQVVNVHSVNVHS